MPVTGRTVAPGPTLVDEPGWAERLPRLALLALPAFWTVQLGLLGGTWCFLDYVNLPFHEAGHLFFAPFGSTLHYLGGTLGQLAVPLLLVGYFLLTRHEPFAGAVCFWWFGQNFINISIYMNDARELALPLVGGGDHDWNELFFRFHMLDAGSVRRTANLTHGLGVVLMLAGLAWAALFVIREAERRRIARWAAQRHPLLQLFVGTAD